MGLNCVEHRWDLPTQRYSHRTMDDGHAALSVSSAVQEDSVSFLLIPEQQKHIPPCVPDHCLFKKKGKRKIRVVQWDDFYYVDVYELMYMIYLKYTHIHPTQTHTLTHTHSHTLTHTHTHTHTHTFTVKLQTGVSSLRQAYARLTAHVPKPYLFLFSSSAISCLCCLFASMVKETSGALLCCVGCCKTWS